MANNENIGEGPHKLQVRDPIMEIEEEVCGRLLQHKNLFFVGKKKKQGKKEGKKS